MPQTSCWVWNPIVSWTIGPWHSNETSEWRHLPRGCHTERRKEHIKHRKYGGQRNRKYLSDNHPIRSSQFWELLFLNCTYSTWSHVPKLSLIEVWYGLKKCEIEELESLLCQITNLPSTTPTEFLFLQTGCLDIGTIVKNKTSDLSTILIEIWWEFHVGQVFQAQSKFPVKGDWTEQVRIDLEDFGIQENFDWIKSKSVNSFKRLVKKKAKQYALSELLRMKSIHSRLDNIEYTELKTQKYLSSGLVSASQGEFC